MRYSSFILGLLWLASCSSNHLSDIAPVIPGELEIQLVSNAHRGIISSTRGEGMISSPLTSNLSISLVHQEKPLNGVYPSGYDEDDCVYAELKETELIDGQYRVLYNPKLYYRPDGGNTRFFGWYPHANTEIPGNNRSEWDAVNRKVTFKIDGSTDIMLAQGIEGNKIEEKRFGVSNPLKFRHVLSQVVISVKIKHKDHIPYWGEITAVSFIKKQQNCVFTLPNPRGATIGDTAVVTFPPTGASDLPLQVENNMTEHPIPLTLEPNEIGYALLAPHKPNDTSATLDVKINTTVGGEHIVPLPYSTTPLPSGVIQHITLEFTAVEIEPTATIKPWEEDPNKPSIPVGDVK